MLDAYTTDNKLSFQFDRWADMCDDLEDYGLDMDPSTYAHDEGVLIVLVPSGHGGWNYDRVISADDLAKALTDANLIEDRTAAGQ